jgi:hypothetical protein
MTTPNKAIVEMVGVNSGPEVYVDTLYRLRGAIRMVKVRRKSTEKAPD